MIVTTQISSDLMSPGFPPLVHAVQGEQYSRQVLMHLYNGGTPWTVPGGVDIALRYQKSDGTVGYYDTLPDGQKAWSAEENRVTIQLAPQMLTVAGGVDAQLELIQNQSILASFPLRLKVSGNLAARVMQSEDYVNWLQWMTSQLEQALKDAAASGEFTGPAPTLEKNAVEYQVGTSATNPPNGAWQSTVPSVPQGQYLWTRHTEKWNNSGPVVDYSVAYQGQDGTDAQLETDTVDYQIGDSGEAPPSGDWLSAIPAAQPGKYLWTRRTKKWNTGTARTDYSVAYSGTNGTDGTPASVTVQTREYQAGPSGQTPPDGQWTEQIPAVPQGQFLWCRYTVKFNTGSPMVIHIPAYQGINGKGAVASVAGIGPGPDGNVPLTAANINALPTAGGTMTGPIAMGGQPLRGLNPPATDDQPETLGHAKQTYVAKANVVNNFTTKEPGFAADARTVAFLSDRVTLMNDSGNKIWVRDMQDNMFWAKLTPNGLTVDMKFNGVWVGEIFLPKG